MEDICQWPVLPKASNGLSMLKKEQDISIVYILWITHLLKYGFVSKIRLRSKIDYRKEILSISTGFIYALISSFELYNEMLSNEMHCIIIIAC